MVRDGGEVSTGPLIRKSGIGLSKKSIFSARGRLCKRPNRNSREQLENGERLSANYVNRPLIGGRGRGRAFE
jgi:hypothetical protein